MDGREGPQAGSRLPGGAFANPERVRLSRRIAARLELVLGPCAGLTWKTSRAPSGDHEGWSLYPPSPVNCDDWVPSERTVQISRTFEVGQSIRSRAKAI